jgi:hypothetical protein
MAPMFASQSISVCCVLFWLVLVYLHCLRRFLYDTYVLPPTGRVFQFVVLVVILTRNGIFS